MGYKGEEQEVSSCVKEFFFFQLFNKLIMITGSLGITSFYFMNYSSGNITMLTKIVFNKKH